MLYKPLIFSLLTPLAALAAHLHGAVNHTGIAKRQAGETGLHKRASNSKWSFYDVGRGACGDVNQENDFIVALNAAEFGSGYPGPKCGQSITMTFNGKTTTAVIKDRCPGCPPGGLDLSRGLFRFFAAESAGIIFGEWHYNDGSGAPPPPPPPPKPPVEPPKPTTTWKPEPTTTWKPEPSTTWTPSSIVAASSSSSSSSVQPSSSRSASLSTSAVPSPPSKNTPALDQFLLQMGRMMVSAASH